MREKRKGGERTGELEDRRTIGETERQQGTKRKERTKLNERGIREGEDKERR